MKFAFEGVGLFKRKVLVWRMAFINLIARKSILGDGAVVVSITSFGRRVKRAALAIESIAAGEEKPRCVILFLEDGLRGATLPRSLERLAARGLTVKYVPDYKSHKKYYFALEKCITEDVPLVTIDDDFLYPKWFLKKLLDLRKLNESCVLCYRAKEVIFDGKGSFRQYVDWPFATVRTHNDKIFFTSGGGALLPICLLENLKREGSEFLKVCPQADDVWLNYIAAKSGIKSRLVFESSIDFTPVETAAEGTLWAHNGPDGNDRQLRATYDADVLGRIAADK